MRGLNPHRVEAFKLSTESHFDQKLIDVCGLYLDPPENAIVLCMDEKTSIQALDNYAMHKHVEVCGPDGCAI